MFLLIVTFSIHLTACLWLITASALGEIGEQDEKGVVLQYLGTWLEPYERDRLENKELYVIAVYWAI